MATEIKYKFLKGRDRMDKSQNTKRTESDSENGNFRKHFDDCNSDALKVG